MAVLILLFAQHLRKLPNGLLGVHRAGRGVRRIDNDGLGMLVQTRRKRIKVNLEIRDGRRHDDTLRACAALDEHFIFREIRREHHNFIVLADDGLERA